MISLDQVNLRPIVVKVLLSFCLYAFIPAFCVSFNCR